MAVTVALGAVFAAILGWLIWELAVQQTEIRMEREGSAQAHIEYAREQAERRCSGLGTAALWDCVYGEIVTAQDHARAELDLGAQQQMALWTTIMGITAVVGIGVGVISVWVILQTLWATQNMSLDQRRIGEAQVRAYIGVVIADRGQPPLNFHVGGVPEVRLRVINHGSSPARNTRIEGMVLFRRADFPSEDAKGQPAPNAPTSRATYSPGSEATPMARANFTLDEAMYAALTDPESGYSLFVIGIVFYRDVFEHDRETRFCFRLRYVPTLSEDGGRSANVIWFATANYNEAS